MGKDEVFLDDGSEEMEESSPGTDAEDVSEAEEWIGEDWEDEVEEEEEDVRVESLAPQFVDNGNETVSDTLHQLMWKKADSFKEFGYGINWFEALEYCENLNEKKFAGFDDWRLPSYDEARYLFSFQKSNRDKDGAELHIDPLFEPGGGDNTWTHEERPEYQQYAMKFSFVTGNEKWEHKDNEYSHVRVVREERKAEYEPEWRKQSRKFSG
jgi:hypothetical protein